jgi:hypothetical protein
MRHTLIKIQYIFTFREEIRINKMRLFRSKYNRR